MGLKVTQNTDQPHQQPYSAVGQPKDAPLIESRPNSNMGKER